MLEKRGLLGALAFKGEVAVIHPPVTMFIEKWSRGLDPENFTLTLNALRATGVVQVMSRDIGYNNTKGVPQDKQLATAANMLCEVLMVFALPDERFVVQAVDIAVRFYRFDIVRVKRANIQLLDAVEQSIPMLVTIDTLMTPINEVINHPDFAGVAKITLTKFRTTLNRRGINFLWQLVEKPDDYFDGTMGFGARSREIARQIRELYGLTKVAVFSEVQRAELVSRASPGKT